MVNPTYGNIHIDANALEPPDAADKFLVSYFLKLRDREVISVVNPHGVQEEIDDPRTPAKTRRDMEGIYTRTTNLTPEEQGIRSKLQEVMRGYASPGRHAPDAEHIFQAWKNGGTYFVTHDRRIIAKKSEIVRIIGPQPAIVTLRQFMRECSRYGLI